MREEKSRPGNAGGELDTLFEGLREECAAPPSAPGFLAGFRARRDAWRERTDQAATWRLLALRLSPVGALAAGAALVMTLSSGTQPLAPETVPEAPVTAEYPDPFVAGLEEAGLATVSMNDEDAGYELLAVLYEPMGTR
ncbi:MAG: hypothetical protein OYL92_09400 [Acidobacteriota bacterium]|nr:hypothetical protein [Acidobacteriota bacterium]MDE3265179.1 hypothetical protein [Acidobacteriota bacterium]